MTQEYYIENGVHRAVAARENGLRWILAQEGGSMLAAYDLTTQKLLIILHRSLVEARMLALAGNHQQAYDLADSFEEIPSLMMHWRDDGMEEVRARLADYQSKYPTSASNYLSILDMSEAEFQEMYRPPYSVSMP